MQFLLTGNFRKTSRDRRGRKGKKKKKNKCVFGSIRDSIAGLPKFPNTLLEQWTVNCDGMVFEGIVVRNLGVVPPGGGLFGLPDFPQRYHQALEL